MALPEQEHTEFYTETEVQHLVAREVMKHRMGDFEVKLSGVETSMSAMFAKLEASIHTVMIQITKSADLVKECREDLKREIDREYATKLEVQRLEGKVDKMWAKITVAVSLSVGFIQLVLSYFGVG